MVDYRISKGSDEVENSAGILESSFCFLVRLLHQFCTGKSRSLTVKGRRGTAADLPIVRSD
jgi:hypothetical protein